MRNLATTDETARILSELGKLIRLAQDETPTIATVTDREKLKAQQFFANSQNGDKVIIYTLAKKPSFTGRLREKSSMWHQ